jgi:hypothetical protein
VDQPNAPANPRDVACGWTIAQLADYVLGITREHEHELAEVREQTAAEYHARGWHDAEAAMDADWRVLARRVRVDAERHGNPFKERRRRELAALGPKPGDYTGHLTATEYAERYGTTGRAA